MSAENPDVVFVKEYVKTRDALLAFNRAGYQTGGVSAKVMAERTLARPEIRIAIEVVRDLGYEREQEGLPVDPLSREGLVDRLDAIHDEAMASGSFPSAINAVKTQAQLMGYMDTVVNVNHNVRPADLSLADLRAMVAKELGGNVIDVTPSVIEQPALIEAREVND